MSNKLTLDKENFVAIMTGILTQSKIDEKFSRALGLVSEGRNIYRGGELYLQALLDILALAFDDSVGFIEWWLDNKDGRTIIKSDGVEVTLDTPEKLYDFLSEMKAEGVIGGKEF